MITSTHHFIVFLYIIINFLDYFICQFFPCWYITIFIFKPKSFIRSTKKTFSWVTFTLNSITIDFYYCCCMNSKDHTHFVITNFINSHSNFVIHSFVCFYKLLFYLFYIYNIDIFLKYFKIKYQ